MSDSTSPTGASGKDSVWPLFAVYAFMVAGMIGTSLNTDPIKLDYSVAFFLGLACVFAIAIYFAAARLRRQTLFAFGHSTIAGSLGWHMFILTGIVFICFLLFLCIVQIAVLTFNAPVFDGGCEKISQRDTALFVWEAMAKGAFKFLAKYLPLPAEACAPSPTWTATILMQGIRWFTALVVVWYVVSFARAWLGRVRQGRRPPESETAS